MNITVINAIVKQPATLLQTKWGEKLKAVVHDGRQDIELWRKPNDAALLSLAEGQGLTLYAKQATRQDGCSYTQYEIMGVGDRPPSQSAPTNGNGNGNGHVAPGVQAMNTPVAHPAISADVKEWVGIFEELKAALPMAQEVTWRAAASTLFMQRLQVRGNFNSEGF